MTGRTFVALIATLSVLSPPAIADGATALEGTSWHLSELVGAPMDKAVSATLVISADSVGGNGGCNSFGGDVKIGADSIDFSQIISTEMACPGLAQEEAYFAALDSATGYAIIGGDLILNGPAGERLARLAPAP